MNGQILSGRYEIVQILGRGAFGHTFLAKDLQRPGHPQCVVKQLSYTSQEPQALADARRLFKSEAEILEKLGQHDQIPRLLAEFEENNQFYLVQEFISGHTLDQEIRYPQSWSEHQVINLLTEVLPVLAFVHSQGVIHRDIKPANLMRRATDGKLILIDFGAVKDINNQIPQAQSTPTVAIGTPAYMPIEQFQGYPLFNSDIYALGMIVIQALLGLPANELTKLRANNSPHPGEIFWRNQAQVSPTLADVIDKMVRFNSRERYQSASEVLADLGKTFGQSKAASVASTIISQTESKNESVKPSPKINVPVIAGVATLILAGVGFVIYHQLPQTKAIAIYQQGLDNLEKKNRSAAIKHLTAAIRLNSKYAEAFYQRANARFESGDNQGAVEDATQAININSNYAEAYTRRCGAYVNLRQYQKADEDCTKALNLKPDYNDAYLNRAAARSNLGDNQGALADYTKLIQLYPDDVKAYNNRGFFYLQKLKDYDKAIADYNQAIRLNSNTYPDAYNGRGSALAAVKKLPAALEDFNKAVIIKPDFAQAYFNRAHVYVELQNKEQAIADFQKADTLCSQQGLTTCAELAQDAIQQLQQQ